MVILQLATIALIGIYSIHSLLNRYWVEPPRYYPKADPWRWMN